MSADGVIILKMSGARSGTAVSADQINEDGRELQIDVHVTTSLNARSIVVIEGKDAGGNQYFPLLRSPAISSKGTMSLTVGRGVPAVANLSMPRPVPDRWRVAWKVSGTAMARVSGTVKALMI